MLQHTITPFLWFDTQAEEAATFYVSLFKNAKIHSVARYGDAGPGAKGTAMTVSFTLDGQEFIALNGGPKFSFTEAISFVINCETQHDVDHFWNNLSNGGTTQQCGWLKDKFGLSWQVVPTALPKLLKSSGQNAPKVMAAMLQMTKIDIAALEAAAAL